MPPDLKFVAFKKSADIPALVTNVAMYASELLGRLYIHAADSDMSWDELGTFALKTTGARQAICYGGGITVLKELAANPDVIFFVLDVTRPNTKKPDGVERTALHDVTDDQKAQVRFLAM